MTEHRDHRRAHRSVVAAAAALAVLLSGCAPAGDPGAAEKAGSGEVRHDLEPLTERFAPLTDAAEGIEATWMSGTLGDDRAPGPSTYWIDAVVLLDESDAADIVAETDPQPTTDVPSVTPGLDDALPDGPFVRSDALDDLFSPKDSETEVFLDEETGTIVVTSRFP